MEALCCLPQQPSCHPPLPLAVTITITSAAPRLPSPLCCSASQPCTSTLTFVVSGVDLSMPLFCLRFAVSQHGPVSI